jgi:hypothetical protein
MRIRFDDNIFVFEGYPFAPSVAFDESPIPMGEIVSADLPPEKGLGWLEHVTGELLFVDALNWYRVRRLMEANEVPCVRRLRVWRLLLHAFQDSVPVDSVPVPGDAKLTQSGFDAEEVHLIRNRVRRHITAYDSTFWEQRQLGLYDVLEAHKFTDRRGEFAAFFEWAMAIALRGHTL